MKKLFLLSFLAVGFGSVSFAQSTPAIPVTTASAASVSDANKSEFKFNDESHDFGTIVEATPASYEFNFTNIGKEPLILTNVIASCGCTTPKWSKEPILPGKTGNILVSYDTNRVGPFSKSVTISSNSKTPSKTLFIKGIVEKKKVAGS